MNVQEIEYKIEEAFIRGGHVTPNPKKIIELPTKGLSTSLS